MQSFISLFSPYFAAVGDPCSLKRSSFFGLPNWWEYLKGEIDPIGKCVPKFKFPDDTWAIGLAAVDILLVLAGIVAVISIILAGISYMTSLGNAEKGVSARKRIVNSLIGLGIVIIASAVVSFIGNQLIK